MRHRILAFCLGLMTAVTISPNLAKAQNTSFGQNFLTFRSGDTLVLRGPHVDIHYDSAWTRVAEMALVYAEESFDTLKVRFNLPNVQSRPQIWVYSSHIGFEQTHLAGGEPMPEGVLGFTEFNELRIGFPFMMSYAEFRHVIRHELVHWFHFMKISDVYEHWHCDLGNPTNQRDSLRINSQISNRRCTGLPFFMPLWWVEGLAEHWSAGEDARDNMFNRDLVINGQISSFSNFLNDFSYSAYPLGGEFIKFLSAHYGEENILELYENMPLSGDFAVAIHNTYKEGPEIIMSRFRDELRRRYYAGYGSAQTLTIHLGRVPTGTQYAIDPLFYENRDAVANPPVSTNASSAKNDSLGARLREFCYPGNLIYLTPENGYTTIREVPVERPEGCSFAFGNSTTLLQGDDRAAFESLHLGAARMSVRNNLLAFVAKRLDRDVIHLYNLETKQPIRFLRFDSLITLRSPSWCRNEEIAFIGASEVGTSDIYLFDLKTNQLRQITHDHYLEGELDCSREENLIVFSSDRNEFGRSGAENLLLINFETGETRTLTHGAWIDESPRFSPDGSRVIFSTDRKMPRDSFATSNICEVNLEGNGRCHTNVLGGATEPVYLDDSTFVFVGFENMNQSLYLEHIKSDTSALDSIKFNGSHELANWEWFSARDSVVLREALREAYRNRFHIGLNSINGGFAASAGGFVFAISAGLLASNPPNDQFLYTWFDLQYSKSKYYDASRWNTNNGGVTYINTAHRSPWLLSFSNRDVIRFEPSWWVRRNYIRETGYEAEGMISHPFSRFQRLDIGLALSSLRSRIILDDSGRSYGDPSEFDLPDSKNWNYDCLCATFSGDLVKDNALWIPSGPISGERYSVGLSLRTNIKNLTLHNYTVSIDWRKYFRQGLYSAWAVQAFGYYSNGPFPERIGLGGSTDFPLYPIQSFYTDKAWTIRGERRIQLFRALIIQTGDGSGFGLPGFQLAPFCNAGQFGLGNRMGNIWGGCGLSLRVPIWGGTSLRLDVGNRFFIGQRPNFPFKSFTVQIWAGPNF